METVQGYVEPSWLSPSDFQTAHLRFERWGRPLSVEVLRPRSERVAAIVSALRERRSESLARLPVRYLVELVAEAARRWLRPDNEFRSAAEHLLPRVTGFSPPMVSLMLDPLLAHYTADNIWGLLADELGDPRVLDGFAPRVHLRGRTKAYGPEVTAHVFAGSGPGPTFVSLLRSLLCKSGGVAKVASQEPLFASLFARSLAELDPQAADCLLVVWWPGGSSELEASLFGAVDCVVAFGSEATISGLREAMPPGKRFVSYGHRMGIGLIGREALSSSDIAAAARRAAADTCIGDQLTCLSPQLLYVEEGGEHSPGEFAHLLSEELDAFQERAPRGELSRGERAALNQFRYQYQFRHYADPARTWMVAPGNGGGEWLVVLDNETAIAPGPGQRTIRVCPLGDLSEAIPHIRAVRPAVSTAGVLVNGQRLTELADRLGEVGVTRVCPLGMMLDPSIGWHHDGSLGLMPLLRWTDIEVPD